MKRILMVLILVVTAGYVSITLAVPQQINYQGYLTRPDGTALDTTVAITFTVYDAETGGAIQWTESHATVVVANGLFHVLLGSVTPLSDIFAANRWLGITVGNNTEMTPRQQIVSVSHAYRVGTVDGASGGTITGNVDISDSLSVASTAVIGKACIGPGTTTSGINAFAAGQSNTAGNTCAAIGGGRSNTATGTYATISGGRNNRVAGDYAVVSGGGGPSVTDSNSAIADYSTVGGGFRNTANGTFDVIGGGSTNSASASYSTVGGGYANTATGYGSVVAGGRYNEASARHAAVGGGEQNVALDTAATVGGGKYNRARGAYSVVAGGGGWTAADSNSAIGDYSVIGGGQGNDAADGYSTVAGGSGNSASGYKSTIGGGSSNHAGHYSTIGGGANNSAVGFYANFATIGGGSNNSSVDAFSTVGGGVDNRAANDGATVAGGDSNRAVADYSTIAGGFHNLADENYATVGGGRENVASGANSTVPGGVYCVAAGPKSFVAGFAARAWETGSFVWGSGEDELNHVTSAFAPYSFTVRCAGGARFYTHASNESGVQLPAGGGAWSALCDVRQKRLHDDVNTSDVLQKVSTLPLHRWSYKTQDEKIQHVGPTAQDFYAAFGLGESDTTISTLDPDGVALAAIQELKKENDQLKNDLAELRSQFQSHLAKEQQTSHKEN